MFLCRFTISSLEIFDWCHKVEVPGVDTYFCSFFLLVISLELLAQDLAPNPERFRLSSIRQKKLRIDLLTTI
jgi:hypothetical protein